MSEIKLDLSDEQLARLREVASESGTSSESIVQTLIQSFLESFSEEERTQRVDQTFERVIRKNLELYRRLAQ